LKRIGIFCDGTWNRTDVRNPTNVVLLANTVKPTAGDGISQVVQYVSGVGTGQASSKVARGLDRVLGGGLGWGLDDNIMSAYRNLVFCYEPGDEICIFGFSRGAYTARSLAGFIRSSGIAPIAHLARIPEAFARYRKRDGTTKPEDPQSYTFREDFAPQTATSEAEWKSRRARGSSAILLTISYLGVWDTVGALGVPSNLLIAPLVNGKYKFHDADLSSSVKSARHAVAIDERRKTFPPTLWDNLDRLNGGASGDLPYQQIWFPGDHGSVGGGGDLKGLSSITLEWIADGAQKAGLDLSWSILADLAAGKNYSEALKNHRQPPGLIARILMASSTDRDGPADLGDLSDAAIARWCNDESYRPKTLAKVDAQLYRLSRKDRDQYHAAAVNPPERPDA
jgi:uncharacterized protein (DUF2235 family)